MRKPYIKLEEKDKAYLKNLLSEGVEKVRLQKRIMALQMLDEGMNYKSISKRLGVVPTTVSDWAKKYKTTGLAFLADKARSGRPVALSSEDQAKVRALANSKPPEGYAKWSLRLLSNRLVELEILESISHSKVADILKKTNQTSPEAHSTSEKMAD